MVVVRMQPVDGYKYKVIMESRGISVVLAYSADWVDLQKVNCAVWSYSDGEVVIWAEKEVKVEYSTVGRNLIVKLSER